MVWYGGLETVIRLEVLYCYLGKASCATTTTVLVHDSRPVAYGGGLKVLLPDRSHEESQNANFEQNNSVATVHSLMHTPVLQMDVKSVEKESVYFSLPF